MYGSGLPPRQEPWAACRPEGSPGGVQPFSLVAATARLARCRHVLGGVPRHHALLLADRQRTRDRHHADPVAPGAPRAGEDRSYGGAGAQLGLHKLFCALQVMDGRRRSEIVLSECC